MRGLLYKNLTIIIWKLNPDSYYTYYIYSVNMYYIRRIQHVNTFVTVFIKLFTFKVNIYI